eukprot:SAG22_NODE_5936_length_928_cov_1.027744_2_plen_26_part_01
MKLLAELQELREMDLLTDEELADGRV